MDKKSAEGNVDELKGHVKEGAGGLTGDRDLQREGRTDQIKGKVKEAIGHLRERAKDVIERKK